MKKLIVALGILLFANLAQANVYFCNFSHRADDQSQYRNKFSDIIFKNFQGTLHDDSGDLAVSIHYSSSKNIVTQVITDKKVHVTFSDPKNGNLLAQKSTDQGKALRVRSMNNWLISCTSIIGLP